MATQTTNIPGSGYGNIYVDSLIWGCKWMGDPVEYWFGSGYLNGADSSIGAFTGREWSQAEMDAFEFALSQYEAVCNLEFEAAESFAAADMVWWLAPESAMGEGSLGMHEVPDGSYPQIYGYFNYDEPSWNNLTPGSYGYITIIHELGHGVGLAHPHDGGGEGDATKFPGVRSPWSTGTNGLNQGIWTTMSYNDGWSGARSTSSDYGWQGSLMAFDVAALQALYGANMTTRTGDDVYQLPTVNVEGTGWSCIWDAGGIDTISNAGSSLGATINLNEAPLTGSNAGGYISRAAGIVGGYTIANDALIENATGGSGNDTLVGNAAANVLDGGLGQDTMTGGAGNDTFHVDNSRDRVSESSGGGTDTVIATVTFTLPSHAEILQLAGSAAIGGTGNNLANTLIGNGAANALNGGTGQDVIVGGGGGDRLTGGRDADIFRFDDGDAGVGTVLRDTVTDFKSSQNDRIDVSAIDANSAVDGDQAFSFIGTAAFGSVAGQLRFAGGMLMGDVNGDGVADFEIALSGVSSFSASWAIL